MFPLILINIKINVWKLLMILCYHETQYEITVGTVNLVYSPIHNKLI